jgi:hypothetical protein
MISTDTPCHACGSAVDVALLGGVCPRCVLGEALLGPAEESAFDGHELLGEIARGGMGVVYRARQLEPERVVALKTLRGASLDSPEALARFRHEAEVMVALDHPAILPVHHYGEQDGIPFFTMKLADGGTLADAIGDYAGQWRRIAQLTIAVADAVQHAHGRGVLHRDLKPGNILFDTGGQPYVSDFGIAKLADPNGAALTQTVSMLGTPFYVAPEVAAGGARAATVASDCWSLGVILYELLAGRRPFAGGSVAEVMRALTDDEPAPLRDAPRDLEVIALKALRKEAAQRYTSVRAFGEDLRCWLDGRPITARAVPMHERSWLWVRRNPLQAALATMLAIALVAAMAALAFGLRAAKRETLRVSEAQVETQHQLRAALLHQARSGRVSREMGWRQSGLDALRRAYAIQPGDDVRDELVAHLAGFDLEPGVRTFTDIVMPSSSLKYGLRTHNDTPKMAVARLGDLTNLFDLPDPYTGRTTVPIFAPDDRWVAVGTKAGTRVFSMTGKHEQVAHWPDFLLCGASTDRTLLHLGSDTHWRMIDTATWQEVASGEFAPVASSAGESAKKMPTFHPDTRIPLGAVIEDSEVRVLDWRTGAEVRRIKTVRPALTLRWSGGYLVVSCGDLGHAFDFRRGREVFLGPGFSTAQVLQTVRSDTELLASSALRQTALWHLHSGQRLVSGAGFTAGTVADDGEHFMGRIPRSEIGRIVRPTVMQFLPEAALRSFTEQKYRALALSPDGRLLAMHDRTQIAVHAVESGKLLARQDVADAIALGFSSDGQTLLVLHAAGLEGWTLGRAEKRLTLTKAFTVPAPKGRTFLSGRMLQDGERFLAATQKLKPYNELWRLWRDRRKWERQPAPEVTSASITDVTPDGVFNIGGQNQYNVVNNIKELRFIMLEQENLRNALGGFSPDGRQLVMVDVTYGWKLYGEEAWKQPAMKVMPGHSTVKTGGSVSTSQMPAWAKSGRWFAVSPDGRRVRLVDATTQQVHLTLESPIDLLLDAMLLSEDERILALQRRGGSVEVWHLDRLRRELQALGVESTLPAPPASKPTPPALEGDWEEAPLPPWSMAGQPGA